jgi:hypothetical protein
MTQLNADCVNFIAHPTPGVVLQLGKPGPTPTEFVPNEKYMFDVSADVPTLSTTIPPAAPGANAGRGAVFETNAGGNVPRSVRLTDMMQPAPLEPPV